MDNFFESLKQNLENRPEPEFREAAWRAMQKKLIEHDQTPTAANNKWFWSLPFLILFIGGSGILNYFFYHQLQKQENGHKKNITTILQIDTVYQQKVVYITDTIVHRQIEYRNALNSNLPVLAKPVYPSPFTIDRKVLHPDLFNPLKRSEKATIAKSSEFTTKLLYNRLQTTFQQRNLTEKDGNIEPPEDFNKWDQIVIASKKFDNPDLSVIAINHTDLKKVKKRKKTFRQVLYPMRPKQFIVGIKGGWVTPVHKEINHSSGFSTGLEIALGFSDHLRLFAEFNFMKLSYQTDEMNDHLGVPVIESPDDDFGFLKAEIVQPKLQYSVGMQYLFNIKKRFQPFFGVGFSTVKTLPYELSYEFENEFSDLEAAIESIIEGTPLTHQLLLKTGWEFELDSHWRWKLEGFYYNTVNEKEIYTPNNIGIQTGLLIKI